MREPIWPGYKLSDKKGLRAAADHEPKQRLEPDYKISRLKPADTTVVFSNKLKSGGGSKTNRDRPVTTTSDQRRKEQRQF